jgi:hypothetical protein
VSETYIVWDEKTGRRKLVDEKEWRLVQENEWRRRNRLFPSYTFSLETDTEQTLRRLREEGEKQLQALSLTRQEVSELRAKAEQMLGDANTQQLGQLRAQVAKLAREMSTLEATHVVLEEEYAERGQLVQDLTDKVQQLTTANEQLSRALTDAKRMLPDPNDPKDWTGDPYWQQPAPTEGWTVSDNTVRPSPSQLAKEGFQKLEQSAYKKPWVPSDTVPKETTLYRLFFYGSAGLVGIALSQLVAHLLHWI